MNNNTTTVKMEITIKGKIAEMDACINQYFYKWTDLKSEYDTDSIWQNVNRAINKLEKFDYIDIKLTDGDYFKPEIYHAINFTQKYNYARDEITIYGNTPDTNNTREYKEIETIDYKKFKRQLKKVLIDYFKYMDVIHINAMHDVINKTA